MLQILYTIVKHYKVLGISGIILLLKRNFNYFEILNVKLRNYKFPIELRNKTSDLGVFYQVFLAQSYQLNYYLEPKVIIDCGANIGLATIFFKNKFPKSKIISIEPEESNFKMLLKNTKQYENIICLNYGIWNKTANLKVEKNSGNWDFTVKEVLNKDNNTVSAISINEIVERYDINQIDILKIDIEGSERELFKNNWETWLKLTKVLIIELHDGLKPGASKSFFKAISNFDFRMIKKDENLIFYLK
ncbi:FkbM family methyltransferase [Neotamlana laminarinivorans]|uniref:FkbM family methyltransferase n=1 Tax=Neotamlana laminarinivorans TaxID=2883124 RepID=A0A9X1I293_9FLAO|nr:FkbM family methyltransferase [Tamlana laminarinivorans]MCB4799715.1 FkbM family methyltransferase [Tamlana laminarinivorans]